MIVIVVNQQTQIPQEAKNQQGFKTSISGSQFEQDGLTSLPLLKTLHSTAVPYTDRWTKKELLQYFINSWQLNDLLFSSIIQEEAFYENPDPLRNPLVFYLGHTAAFCINKLKQVGILEKPINNHFEQIFEIGVDPARPQEIQKELESMKWPSVAEVWQYRRRCFEVIYDYLQRTTILLPIEWDGPLWALLMGIEHDRIHFETSSMLIRQLDNSKLKRPDAWHYAPTAAKAAAPKMIAFDRSQVILGKKEDFPTYGWDNEYGKLALTVDEFAIRNTQISNAEFKEFVDDGGYQQQAFWTEDSWKWKAENTIEHPKFWNKKADGEFSYRTLFEDIPMPANWPVEVTHYEAEAFCRWKGRGFRLMNEAEWNVATCDHEDPHKRQVRNNDVLWNKNWNNNLKYGSPHAVGSLETAQTKDGIYDLFGNTWELLNNDFAPLPGFKSHSLYKNFSLPFFDSHHSMMIGGSWASTGTSASKFYRLWFRKYFYQHAGFRLAIDPSGI